MAYSEQSGVAITPGRALGRRPIVLAQLPHIGPVPMSEPTRLPIGDNFAERVTARGDRDTGSEPPATHFVDGSHNQHNSDATAPPTRKAPKLRSTPKGSGDVPAASPSAALFRLHSQVAPYAGIIVAMALIACAGLLYWIISGPSAAPLDYPDFYNIGRGNFGAQSLNLPDRTTPTPSPNSLAPVATTGPVPTTEPFESVEPFAPTTDVKAEPWTLESNVVEMPPTDEPRPELPFPQTSNPSALDFSLLQAGNRLPTVGLDTLPQVAGQNVPELLTPTINR